MDNLQDQKWYTDLANGPHQCMLKAFCDTTGLLPTEVMDEIGVTGEEMISGYNGEEYARGFHISDFIEVGLQRNYALVPLHLNPVLCKNKHDRGSYYLLIDTDDIVDRANELISNHPCFALGINEKGNNHAWVLDGNMDFNEFTRIHEVYRVVYCGL